MCTPSVNPAEMKTAAESSICPKKRICGNIRRQIVPKKMTSDIFSTYLEQESLEEWLIKTKNNKVKRQKYGQLLWRRRGLVASSPPAT
jgi:hypothetical protein